MSEGGVHAGLSSSYIQPALIKRELVDINQSLSFEHIVCIDTAIQSRNDLTQQCKDAASTLTVQINSNSFLGSVSIDDSALSDFCKSSCGLSYQLL